MRYTSSTTQLPGVTPISRTTLSPEDLEACLNLKHIFLQAKRDSGIRQKDIERETGIDQGKISLHINGKRAMETGTVIRYANFFGCTPGEIDQRLDHLEALQTKPPHLQIVWAPILTINEAKDWLDNKLIFSDLSAKHPKVPLAKTFSHRCFAVTLKSTRLSPRYLPGDLFIYDPEARPVSGCLAVYDFGNEWVVGYYDELGGKKFIQVPGLPPYQLEGAEQFIASVSAVFISSTKLSKDF